MYIGGYTPTLMHSSLTVHACRLPRLIPELYALEDTTLSSPDSVVPTTYGQLRAKVYLPIVTNIFLTLPSRRSMEEYKDLTSCGVYRTYLSRISYAAAKILRLTWQRAAIFQDGNPLTTTKDTRWLWTSNTQDQTGSALTSCSLHPIVIHAVGRTFPRWMLLPAKTHAPFFRHPYRGVGNVDRFACAYPGVSTKRVLKIATSPCFAFLKTFHLNFCMLQQYYFK